MPPASPAPPRGQQNHAAHPRQTGRRGCPPPSAIHVSFPVAGATLKRRSEAGEACGWGEKETRPRGLHRRNAPHITSPTTWPTKARRLPTPDWTSGLSPSLSDPRLLPSGECHPQAAERSGGSGGSLWVGGERNATPGTAPTQCPPNHQPHHVANKSTPLTHARLDVGAVPLPQKSTSPSQWRVPPSSGGATPGTAPTQCPPHHQTHHVANISTPLTHARLDVGAVPLPQSSTSLSRGGQPRLPMAP